MLKKIACFMLALIIVTISQSACADTGMTEPSQLRYTYIRTVYASLTISGTTATCIGKGRGVYADTTTHIQVTLQGRPAGSSHWYTAASWTASASGIGTAIVNQTHSVATENSYRVRVRCQIKDSDGNVLETVYKYSAVSTI